MKCLLDLDGVITDFMTAAHKFHNIPYSYEQYPYELANWDCLPPSTATLTSRDFWDLLTHDFWANIPLMPDAGTILSMAESAFGPENICILTSPTLSHQCASGKMEWIAKYMPNYSRRFLIGPAKHFCAGPNSVLIDDADHNTRAFREAGGLAILVPRKWNSMWPCDTIATITPQIAGIKELIAA